jgi:hypothetical protein
MPEPGLITELRLNNWSTLVYTRLVPTKILSWTPYEDQTGYESYVKIHFNVSNYTMEKHWRGESSRGTNLTLKAK